MKTVNTLLSLIVLGILMAGFVPEVEGQQKANYDEDKIPDFQLPDPLLFPDGSVVTKTDWPKRREEILELFKKHVYGTMPEPPPKNFRMGASKAEYQEVELVDRSEGDSIVQVKARMKEVTLYLTRHNKSALTGDSGGVDQSDPVTKAKLLIVLPINDYSGQNRVCPIFLGYNFRGNHSIHRSPAISLAKVWNKQRELVTAGEDTRGQSSGRWPLAKIISRGYGLATLYYGDIDPDFDDGFENGVHKLYPDLQNRPDNWSSIGAWAWGLHRVMDYFETAAPEIARNRVALIGHSRLGKTSLWAGATDQRFRVVISNNSGCGGAALSRRRIGESVKRINTKFPHWFCKQHRDYNDNENECPVDQHMLVALMAPRAVYVASAKEDRWADPRGEFLSCYHAQPVFNLLGVGDMGVSDATMPELNKPVGNSTDDRISYHIRSGKHGVTDFDWQQYLSFARWHF